MGIELTFACNTLNTLGLAETGERMAEQKLNLLKIATRLAAECLPSTLRVEVTAYT
jgi:hypothetical protein